MEQDPPVEFPVQSKLPCTVEWDKDHIRHVKNMLGKTVWVSPASGKSKPIHRVAFAQQSGYSWWVMQKDGEFWYLPHGDLISGENSQ